MLDGILGRNFSSKCKTSIKGTKSRIDAIRRRRNATQKFLKKDVADLLANGLDINAYGRADGLIAELIISSCYDFIEQSCECVLKHLSVMQKQSECPEECKTAIASLMFAAARFSDLPELRDLRHVLQEKYGNSLEYFVNQKFVENLASKPSTMEKRIQLLQDIASEFSIKWDSRAFERTMAKPPVSIPQDQPRALHVIDKSPYGSNTVPKGVKNDVLSKEKHEPTSDGHRSRSKNDNVSKRAELDHQFFGRQDVSGNGHRPPNGREDSIPKRDRHDVLFQGRQEVITDKHEKLNIGNGHRQQNGRVDSIPKRDPHDVLFHGRQEVITDKHEKLSVNEGTTPRTHVLGSSSRGKRPESINVVYKLHNVQEDAARKKDSRGTSSSSKEEIALSSEGLLVKDDGKDTPIVGNKHAGRPTIASSTWKVQVEETDGLKSANNFIPPPYVKPPIASKHGGRSRSKDADFDWDGPNGASTDPSGHNRTKSVEKSERVQLGSDHPDYERQVVGIAGANIHSRNKDHQNHDNITGDLLPKPRSVRRKHSKSSSNNHDGVGNSEDKRIVKRVSSGRRRGDTRQGLQILFDDEHHQRDDEERMIDKLLLHYSKKPSAYELEKSRRKSKAHPSHHTAADRGQPSHHDGSRDDPDEMSEFVPLPGRSVSLPPEQTASSEAPKVYARAASFQSDRSNEAKHVHPKLPDYDDLAARFAALKGR